MKYIIMADGKGTRWNHYKGINKHFIKVDGKTLLERTIELIKKYDKTSEVIITSHNDNYNFSGSTRYEPKNNKIELDRFTYELIDRNVCFLYGDTLYSENAIKEIVEKDNDTVLFFGNSKKIFAVKIFNPEIMKKNIDNVKMLYNAGKIDKCVGWQVYQSINNLSYDKFEIKCNFIVINDITRDFNEPKDYEDFIIEEKEKKIF